MGRPRKRLVAWSELVAWLGQEGYSEWMIKTRLSGKDAPAWRYPRPLPGFRRRLRYDTWAVAAWLVLHPGPKTPQERDSKTGQFLCKN